MMWFKKKIKSQEFKELSEKIQALQRRIDLLDIDLSLQTDKLAKAISKKVIKKKEEIETDNNKSKMFLPH